MAITKFTNDKGNNKYDDVIPSEEAAMDIEQLFLKKLVDKLDEGLDKTNEHINKIITVGSNTTLSFGDLTATTDPKSGKVTYSIALSATRDFGGKTGNQTKSITLTLV